MKKTCLHLSCSTLFLTFAAAPLALTAAPILNPTNGHYYDAVLTPTNWSGAKALAEAQCYRGLPGHLATITTSNENDFIVANFPQVRGTQTEEYWIGAFQPPGSPEPGGNWQWITGETFEFPNWASGEPNNAGGNEDAAHFYAGFQDGCWNDRPASDQMAGYVVEYEPLRPRILPAIEVVFPTRQGAQYQLQVSTDFSGWSDFGPLIPGIGGEQSVLAPTRPGPKQFFRVDPIDLLCGLAAYYPFNGNADDASGNLNNGTINGAIFTTNRFGMENSAFYFDGSGAHLSLTNSESLHITNGITLAAWIRFEVGGLENPRVVHKHVYQIYTVGTGDSREIVFACPPVAEIRSNPVTAEAWVFIVGTYDRESMRLYVNGTLAAESVATALIDSNDLGVEIGRNVQTLSDGFKGIIDDVRIYNRALSAREVLHLFNAAE